MDFLRFPLHAADGTSAARCKDRNLGTSCRQLAIAHYINFSHLGKAPGMPAYGPSPKPRSPALAAGLWGTTVARVIAPADRCVSLPHAGTGGSCGPQAG